MARLVRIASVALALTLLAGGPASAHSGHSPVPAPSAGSQPGDMAGMDMSGMDMSGMDMNGTGMTGMNGTDMSGKNGMDMGGHQHGTVGGATLSSTQRGLVVGGFAAVNAAVLLAALAWRRRLRPARAPR